MSHSVGTDSWPLLSNEHPHMRTFSTFGTNTTPIDMHHVESGTDMASHTSTGTDPEMFSVMSVCTNTASVTLHDIAVSTRAYSFSDASTDTDSTLTGSTYTSTYTNTYHDYREFGTCTDVQVNTVGTDINIAVTGPHDATVDTNTTQVHFQDFGCGTNVKVHSFGTDIDTSLTGPYLVTTGVDAPFASFSSVGKKILCFFLSLSIDAQISFLMSYL